jgi:chemotaxis protein MotB
MSIHSRIGLSLACALVMSCVSRGKYETAVSDAASARAELSAARAESNHRVAGKEAEVAQLRKHLKDALAQCGQIQGELDQAETRERACGSALDQATATEHELRKELTRLGRDADQLLQAKGMLSSSLEQARARLAELRQAQAAAETRAAMLKSLAQRLKRMVDAGELKIVLRSGRMVLVMPNDVLFDSGKAEIKPGGKEALSQVASALASFENRRFQVAGHTDNEPIRYSGFHSNWELSTERALRVVEFLLKSGMRAEALSAAGYAEFDPVASNESAEGKGQNRRIEITAQPDISEIVAVPNE